MGRLPARLLPRMMRKSLQKTLDCWLGELKTAAEAVSEVTRP